VQATVPCLAKLNLDLRVLHRRSDGYHEIRTIFQTINLADSLHIELGSAKRTQIDLSSSIDIKENLVVRSAKLVLEHLRAKAWVRFVLKKKIPMGAGLGGGSSDAASVFIALPALLGKKVPVGELVRLAESLGSDIPFFLLGGTALGLGRGTELYPLPDQLARHAVVVATGIHVSTAEAYRELGRDVTNSLTSASQSPILREFQTIAWALDGSDLDQSPLKNDFEEAVFKRHPELAAVARKLWRSGARQALMTGSGSAIFGLFDTSAAARAALSRWPAGSARLVRFVTRRQYRSLWHRALGPAAAFSCIP
jgi:4-diphosphocytidyl-2-C-methyl-D-erythritol kinase